MFWITYILFVKKPKALWPGQASRFRLLSKLAHSHVRIRALTQRHTSMQAERNCVGHCRHYKLISGMNKTLVCIMRIYIFRLLANMQLFIWY